MTDRDTMNRERKRCMILFYVVMLAALLLIIGLWNGMLMKIMLAWLIIL